MNKHYNIIRRSIKYSVRDLLYDVINIAQYSDL